MSTPSNARSSPSKKTPARLWLWLVVCALGLGYLVALGVGPRVSDALIARDHLWLENERFGGPFGVSLNLDSFFYMIDAEDTRKIFLPEARLQSRPLLSFLAHPLARALDRVDRPQLAGASKVFNALLPQYVVFIGFNLLIVVVTYLAFARLIGRYASGLPALAGTGGTAKTGFPRITATAALLGLLLISNEVTKAFFYAAHAQMLNLLVPVLAVLAFCGFSRTESRGRHAGTVCLLAGLGMLAYGGFVVLGFSVAAAWAWRGWHRPDRRLPKQGVELLGLVIVIFAPYAGWVGLVRALTGGFYNHEVVYWHEVVWIAEAARNGMDRLALNLLVNVSFFVRSTLHHWWPAVWAVPVLGWLSWSRWPSVRSGLKASAPVFIGCALVGCAFLVLFTIVGYRVDRLAMPMAAAGLVALGAWAQILEPLLEPALRRRLALGTGVFVAAQMAWMAAKDGPYF